MTTSYISQLVIYHNWYAVVFNIGDAVTFEIALRIVIHRVC